MEVWKNFKTKICSHICNIRLSEYTKIPHSAARTNRTENWKLELSYQLCNELADNLAKEASQKEKLECSKEISRCDITNSLREESKKKCVTIFKGMDTKRFFPKASNRVAVKMPVSSNFTSIIIGRGKIWQTIDHLIQGCEIMNGHSVGKN